MKHVKGACSENERKSSEVYRRQVASDGASPGVRATGHLGLESLLPRPAKIELFNRHVAGRISVTPLTIREGYPADGGPLSPRARSPAASTGAVIGQIHRRHRAVELKRFLARIDKEVPAGLDVHLICDNAATHRTPAVQRWPAPRFHVHFTPTSSSWFNQVERWFGLLTDKQIRRGAYKNAQAGEGHTQLDQDLERRPETLRGRRPRTRPLSASPDI
jgi:hypothetical protein